MKNNPTLQALLINEEYNNLKNPSEKMMLILAVIAKTTDYSSFSKLVTECENLDTKFQRSDFKQLYENIIHSQDCNLIQMFPDYVFFKSYEKIDNPAEAVTQQLRVITIAAMQEIIRLEKEKNIQEELQAFGVPFEKNQAYADMDAHVLSIKFPYIETYLKSDLKPDLKPENSATPYLSHKR